MSKLIKFSIVSFIIALTLIISGFAIGANFEGIKDVFNNERNYTIYEKEFTDEYEKIHIESVSKNVDISKGDVSYPKITYYLSDTETMDISVGNDKTLNIVQKNINKWTSWLSFGWTKKEFETIYIVLPKEYVGEININNISGNIKIIGEFTNANLKTTSGNIFYSGTFNNLIVRLTSGNIKGEDVNINSLDLESISGNVNLINNNIVDFLKVTLKSGNIILKNTTANNYNLKTTSGNIRLSLNDNEDSYKYNLNVTTGSIKLNNKKLGKNYEVGNGILLNAKTTSGNIIINTK